MVTYSVKKNLENDDLYCLRTTFGESLEIFEKGSEIIGNSSKKSSLASLYNKQNNTWLFVEMEFLFSCSTLYFIRLLPSLVRYQVTYLRKFISTRTHALSSFFFMRVTRNSN